MVSLGRRAFRELSSAVGALCFLYTAALAQRPAMPVSHPPAAPIHVFAPPVYHAPVIPTPIMRAPIIYSPAYTLPRNAIVHSAGTIGTVIVHPPFRPIRPRPPIIFVYSQPFLFNQAFSPFNFCWWADCQQFWPWTYGSFTVSSPGPVNYVLQAAEAPVYVAGYEREDTPQLYLQDGTILNVTDYWVVDNQLHFTMVEGTGAEPVEQSIPFEELDMQKTIDANTRKGFRFVLRNEPFERYVHDHPEGPPPVAFPPHQ